MSEFEIPSFPIGLPEIPGYLLTGYFRNRAYNRVFQVFQCASSGCITQNWVFPKNTKPGISTRSCEHAQNRVFPKKHISGHFQVEIPSYKMMHKTGYFRQPLKHKTGYFRKSRFGAKSIEKQCSVRSEHKTGYFR